MIISHIHGNHDEMKKITIKSILYCLSRKKYSKIFWVSKSAMNEFYFKNKVKDNMAKYLVPQECGNKTGVRYAKVTDYKGRGMLFEGDGMNFSALPYTPHEMENAHHPYELPPVHYTVVRVAKAQMGVGGGDSWGAKTHEEFLIPVTKKLEFSFRFKGI